MIIKLQTGDTSGDGHCISKDHYYEVNCTKKELCAAYHKGTEILGVDLSKMCACEYEDTSISTETFMKLYKHGIFDDEDKEWAEEENLVDLDDPNDINPGEIIQYFWCEIEFEHVWLEVAKLGRPELKFHSVYSEIPEIFIGGYGLYSQ